MTIGCSCPTYLVSGGDGAGRGVTAAYWQVSPVSDGTTDTVLLTGISQAGLISQSSNPLTLPSDYCTAAPTMQQLLTAAERYQSSVINISLFYVASKSKS